MRNIFQKIYPFLIGLILAFNARASFAEPFTQSAFDEAKKKGESVLLHFHADWCPTCREQQKVLTKLSQEGRLKDIHLLTVDYDKETGLKDALKVTHQSVLIAFQGNIEVGRSESETSEEKLAKFLDDAFNPKTLRERLQRIKNSSASHMPPAALSALESATEELRKSQLTAHALQVGAKLPKIELTNVHHKKVSIQKLLKSGPVILTFYRGGWCPFCNTQLRAYEQSLDQFRAAGAELVAVSPEKPENAVDTVSKDKLTFEVLHDANNRVAKSLGLVFGVPPELKKIYLGFGLDLEKSQGNPEWKLPIPATYVINRDGKVIYAFLDVDFRNRAEPSDILDALKKDSGQ